ncbi:MAG: hypothetical protein JWL60_2469 [Gemmatimonadetes bacterium]|nr:hypothetical protein [Gemmatimonadota bacterium]
MPPRFAISDRAAAYALQAGAIAVVLVAAPYKLFDLDRFFVPKELVLHLTALVAGVLCVARARQWRMSRTDELLALFLALGLVSALFATNWWLAGRAVAVSVSGAVCFWSARTVARRGLERRLVAALALAGVLGAVTALLQAYGLETEWFSLNRAPGGTFGNRNFMAHLCVITLPAVVLTSLLAPSRRAYFAWTGGVALMGAALVMSRSRAAWLALIAGVVVLAVLGVVALRRGRGGIRPGRLLLLPLAAVLGGGASLVLPNTLNWSSDSPYADTAKSVVNYKEGSGQGRLVQYGNTLKMTLHHPLLGVGPGNWAVDYPKFASRRDPSLSTEGMTSNPWPSSDWMTFLSERGPAAFVVLGLALLVLVADGFRGLGAELPVEERLRAATLLGTIAVLLVVGTFDAVLLLPVPALIAWSLLGALSSPARERRVLELSAVRRIAFASLLAAVTAGAALRSLAQLSAMDIFSSTSRTAALERAAARDPGSYRIRTRLATGYLNRGNCTRARAHASSARDLFPEAPQPRRILRSCGR